MPESDRAGRGHRIRVSQKKSDAAVLIQQIQLLALKQGKTVGAELVNGFHSFRIRFAFRVIALWPSQFWRSSAKYRPFAVLYPC